MQLAVLDPRNGDTRADLYVLDPDRGVRSVLGLGYVPELHHDPVSGELILVETELGPEKSTRYWLRTFSLDTWQPRLACEIGPRPMYAGYPGRSTRVAASPSGRFLYALQLGPVIGPVKHDVYRVGVVRYDRRSETLETGKPVVDSCLLDFGCVGEEDLYFHLSCDFPSTVAFACFSAAGVALVQLEDTPPRTHRPQETCGSWRAGPAGPLYCVTGEGKVYEVPLPSGRPRLLAALPLPAPRSVPLHSLHGCGDRLFVGVSHDDGDRSLSLSSEVWQLDRTGGGVLGVLPLPVAAINFVVAPDGHTLYGVSPYDRMLFALDTAGRRPPQAIEGLGVSPAEVLLLP